MPRFPHEQRPQEQKDAEHGEAAYDQKNILPSRINIVVFRFVRHQFVFRINGGDQGAQFMDHRCFPAEESFSSISVCSVILSLCIR